MGYHLGLSVCHPYASTRSRERALGRLARLVGSGAPVGLAIILLLLLLDPGHVGLILYAPMVLGVRAPAVLRAVAVFHQTAKPWVWIHFLFRECHDMQGIGPPTLTLLHAGQQVVFLHLLNVDCWSWGR